MSPILKSMWGRFLPKRNPAPRPSATRPVATRLAVEVLEDRTLLSAEVPVPGDVLVLVSGSTAGSFTAAAPAQILEIDPAATANPTTLLTGTVTTSPIGLQSADPITDVAAGLDGSVDFLGSYNGTSGAFRVVFVTDPQTGAVTPTVPALLRPNPTRLASLGQAGGNATSIGVDSQGDVLLAVSAETTTTVVVSGSFTGNTVTVDAPAEILEIDPTSGAATTLLMGTVTTSPSGSQSADPITDVAAEPDGSVDFLGRYNGTSGAFRVGFVTDPQTCEKTPTVPALLRANPPSTSTGGGAATRIAVVPDPFLVTNTADSGPGSLRQAIINANEHPGTDTIHFHIDCGTQTITPTSTLPTITDPVIIDGTSQPGYGETPLIQLDGTGAGVGASGLTITAGGSTVRGLDIVNFSGAGIALEMKGGNLVQGNYIGTDVTGTASLPNGAGLVVKRSADNTIGGTTSTARNIISGNTQDGIDLEGDSVTTGNVIEGNYIGTQADGSTALGNGGNGVYIDIAAAPGQSPHNLIGGTDPGAGNTIAYNGSSLKLQGHGILVANGSGNSIRRNSIYKNAGRGIALGTGSWYDTLNDLGDGDTGANGLQNYPVLTSVTVARGQATIKGFLNSQPKGTYTIEFFANTAPNRSGFGDGEKFLGDTTLPTDANGHVDFTLTLADAGSPDDFIAATATDTVSGDTSGFSMVSRAGDGIADAWKTQGIDINEDGTIDLTLPGANPDHKNVYVEVDAMQSRAPAQATLDQVVAAFAAAPVNNPDGQNGINLHAQLDDTNIPLQGFPNVWAEFDQVKTAYFGSAAERIDPNAANILKAKALVYHYCLFADTYGAPGSDDYFSSGLSRGTVSNDFMVTLGSVSNAKHQGWLLPNGNPGTPDEQAGTFMHELGHNLGLHHGGGGSDYLGNAIDTLSGEAPDKPNYYSVMNYLWQMPYRLPANPNPEQQAYHDSWTLDYSRKALPTLDESHLVEADGIQGNPNHTLPLVRALVTPTGPVPTPTGAFAKEAGPVDWNRNSIPDANPYSLDINGDGHITQLVGQEDWSQLSYYFLESPAVQTHGAPSPVESELTPDMLYPIKASTGTSLSVSASTPLAGVDPVTLTATVTVSAPGSGTLTSTVDFFDTTAAKDLGSATVVNGVASLNAGTFVAGGHAITATYSGDSNFLSSFGTASLTALVPASLSGSVFADFNDDGQIDFEEAGISGVSVHLTGTDDLGHAVDRTLQTDGDGAYLFLNLRPGSYYLTKTSEPSGYTAGIDSVGTAGGSLSTTVADQFFVQLAQGVNGLNYNYGEQPAATGPVQKGQTAGIGFWNNKNGQALILALNGGGSSHELGDWLAATFVNLYGANSGNDLAGKSNAYVAALFQQDFLQKGMKLDAQVLATALSVYATNATLDSTQAAAKYGFTVSGYGVGTATFNVGSGGDAFGVANNTTMTVLDLLLATDAQSANGVLYNGNTAKRNEANNVYSALNQAGSIS
jgi:hypothetical protein